MSTLVFNQIRSFNKVEKYSFFLSFFLSRAKFALCRENTTGASLLHTAVAAERWDFPKTVSEWWNICKFSDHSKCQEGDGSAPGPHLSSLVGSPGLKWQVCLQFRAVHLICKTWSVLRPEMVSLQVCSPSGCFSPTDRRLLSPGGTRWQSSYSKNPL